MCGSAAELFHYAELTKTKNDGCGGGVRRQRTRLAGGGDAHLSRGDVING